MASSISISLFMVATICCLVSATAAGEKQPLPSDVVDRQSRQMYAVPSPVYNYYNPYGAQVLVPTVEGEQDDLEVTGRQSSETVSITPVDTECLKGDVGTNGYGGCAKGSSAPSGNIVAKFGVKDQVGVVALVPNARRYSKVKITCSDLTNAVIYTKSGKIAATTDSPVTETKQTQVVIVSTGKATVNCSWEAS